VKLALSTAAAPDYTLAELFDACVRRGLAALELVADDRHGVGPELEQREVLEIVEEAGARGVTIAAYRSRGLWEATAPETVRLAAWLGAPVVVTLDESEDDVVDVINAAHRYAAVGARLLVEHRSAPGEVAELRALAERAAPHALGLAWDAEPADGGLDAAAEIITAAGPLLGHIRLRGGGPETARGEGQGIGSLMGRLTLARYPGCIAIAPSTPRYRYAWNAWLGRGRGGWGCGSKTSDDSLVSLS